METTPLESPYATQELHINGDISFAVMQYHWLTGDVNMFLTENFDKVLFGIADFWISKMEYDQNGMCYF